MSEEPQRGILIDFGCGGLIALGMVCMTIVALFAPHALP